MSDNLYKSENSFFPPIWPEKHFSQTYQRDCLKAPENHNSRTELNPWPYSLRFKHRSLTVDFYKLETARIEKTTWLTCRNKQKTLNSLLNSIFFFTIYLLHLMQDETRTWTTRAAHTNFSKACAKERRQQKIELWHINMCFLWWLHVQVSVHLPL